QFTFDALVQGVDQVAEAATRKYFQRVNFRHRREAADARQPIGCASDDAGTMRAVRYHILDPARLVAVVGEVDAARDMAELRVGVVTSGIDDADLDALSGKGWIEPVELHEALAPA